MYVPEDLTELHASFQLKTQAGAIEFVAWLTGMTVPGEVDAIFLDDDRRIVELFRMTDAEPLLPESRFRLPRWRKPFAIPVGKFASRICCASRQPTSPSSTVSMQRMSVASWPPRSPATSPTRMS
jgi:hypothetical protein